MFRARIALALTGSLVSFATDARAQDDVQVRVQRPSRFSIGLWSGGALFDDDVALGGGVGGSGIQFGARAGALLGDWTADGGSFGDTVGIEAELGMSFPQVDDTDGDEHTARVLGWRAHAIIGHLSDLPVHPFTVIGIGGQTLLDRPGPGDADSDLELHAGGGLMMRAGPGAIRFDARVALMSGRDDDLAGAGELHLGYSVELGRRAARIGRIQIAQRGGGMLPEPVFLVMAGEAAPPPRPPPVETPVDRGEGEDDDDDDDGVPDAADTCPRTAETENGVDDGDGCPDDVPLDLAERVGTLVGIEFKKGTTRLSRRSRTVLAELAAVLARHPSVTVEIVGHTARGADPAADRALSEQRAAIVKWVLVDRGLPEERVATSGRGSELGIERIELALAGTRPAAVASAPPLVWSERARLPPDAPAPVWIVSAEP